jgi:antitoxin component YwqK of YwqJK toxin-antitoxin module
MSRKMKPAYLLFFVLSFAFTSCTHETTIMESVYPDGSPKRECVYKGKDSSRELIRERTWYPNKQVQMMGEYKDNKRDGKWIYYYENGKVWSEGFFRNGKSDGKRVTYRENGKIFYEGYYKDDRRVGVWQFYDESGKLSGSTDYSAEPAKSKQPVMKKPG